MTELNIEYAPKTKDLETDDWHDRIVEHLRKYLSQPFDRGDPSSADFAVGDLTTDNTWNTLNLTSIIPEDTTAVILNVQIEDGSVDKKIMFRKTGNSNIYNVGVVTTQVAGVKIEGQVTVFCDSNRTIKYKGSNTTFTAINITVLGWFK